MATKDAGGDKLYLWLALGFIVVGFALWLYGASESGVALTYAERGMAHAGGMGYLGLGTGLLLVGTALGTLFLTRRA